MNVMLPDFYMRGQRRKITKSFLLQSTLQRRISYQNMGFETLAMVHHVRFLIF